MHPLCCVSLESPGIGDQSPEIASSLTRARSLPAGGNAGGGYSGSEATVAGVLYKWTNYGKGWRSRWFLLKNGVLSYSKIRRPENLTFGNDDVRLIGEMPTTRLSRLDSGNGSFRRKPQLSSNTNKSVAIVHLKVFIV